MRNVRALHINCNGKGFYCENSTSFRVCVDMGGGFTMTMDDVEQQCPDNTYCDNMNPFECMEITTTTTTPKSTEASVLTLQWPSSYLANLGMAPATIQPTPAAPINERPPIYLPVPPVAPPPFNSFSMPAVPSAVLPGTTIVKEENADNYLKYLPIIKRDPIDTLPGTVAPYIEGANSSIFNDATKIFPLNSTTSNPVSTLADSSPSDTISTNSRETLNEHSTTFTTPYSSLENISNTFNLTSPNSFLTFNSSTPYIIPTDTGDSMKPISISQTPSTTFFPLVRDSMTSSTDLDLPISTSLLSTTEPYSNLTTLVSITTTDVRNPISTATESELTTENAFNSTSEYPLSSTPFDSPSTVQNLFNSTIEYPISSKPLNSTVQDLYNSTIVNPADSSTLDSTTITKNPLYSTPITENLLNSTLITESPLNSTSITKNPLNSTLITESSLNSTSITENPLNSTPLTENPLNSTSISENTLNSTSITENTLNSTSITENSLNSTSIAENPLNSTSISANQLNSTSITENPLNSMPLDPISTTQNIFYSSTENPLNSASLNSILFNSTSNSFKPTILVPMSANETLFSSTPLNSTLFKLTNENQPKPMKWVPIPTSKNLFNITTENPLNSTVLGSSEVISTTEYLPVSTRLDSIVTILPPLNFTDDALNSSNLVSSTESSTLNSIQPPDLSNPSSPPTKFNVTRENTTDILNLTKVNTILEVTPTTPAPGFETTTVKSNITGSVPQEKYSGNAADNESPLISKVVNFPSNSLPDVPLTPDHVISTRMIQTTEPFNNRVSSFVSGNIANTGAYPSTAPPLAIPLPIPNDPNAYNGCQRPGQYPDENSCHSYYMCNNNVKYKLICPYNMVYSPSLQKCTTAKDHCSNYNDFTCNQAGRFPDSRSCYSYYDCQPSGAGYTVSRVHCPWYSSFQPNNGQCVTNYNACGCQQTPQTCRYPQHVPIEYQGGQATPYTFYPDNSVTYGREYGYPPVSSTNVPIAANTPYLGDSVLPADRISIYNRENSLPVDPSNTYIDRDYIREKLPVGVNYHNFGDKVVPSFDRTPTNIRDTPTSANTNGYIKDYTPIVGNTPYVQENVVPIGDTNTYYQNNVPADQRNTYYQNNVPSENAYTYNGNVVGPVDSANNKYIPANVGPVESTNPYIRDNIAPSNYNSASNHYPPVHTNRLAGTNSNFGDRTRWSQPDPNNQAPGQWTPNYYGSWFN